MKTARFSKLLLFAVALSFAATACKHTPKSPTPIYGPAVKVPANTSVPAPLETPGPGIGNNLGSTGSTQLTPNSEGTPLASRDSLDNYLQDREAFKQDTVYFDFDKYTIRPSEVSKVEAVASYLKDHPNEKVMVEGNCDERGTPEYNRALGERRALSVRESLINLGIPGERVQTVSYGEDRPAVQGHNEAAWAKNRRAEFVLLKPKAGA